MWPHGLLHTRIPCPCFVWICIFLSWSWSRTLATTQQAFCEIFYIWRCIPDAFVERDVLHIHLVLYSCWEISYRNVVEQDWGTEQSGERWAYQRTHISCLLFSFRAYGSVHTYLQYVLLPMLDCCLVLCVPQLSWLVASQGKILFKYCLFWHSSKIYGVVSYFYFCGIDSIIMSCF